MLELHHESVNKMRPVPCQGESAFIYAGLLSPGASACGEGPEPSELLRLVSKVKVAARIRPASGLSGVFTCVPPSDRRLTALRPLIRNEFSRES